MEVASLPSAEEDHVTGHVSKRILQGRPLPAILVDNHPGPRYPNFRPHNRRPSLQKSSNNHAARDGTSTPCDSGVSFSSPDGEPSILGVGGAIPTKAPSRNTLPKVTKLPKKKRKQRTPGVQVTSVGASTTSVAAGGTGLSGVGTGSSMVSAAGGGQAGGGQAGLVSSTSSGVSSGRISEQLHQKFTKISQLGQYGRATSMERTDYSINPEPVPFKPSNFINHHGSLPIGFSRSSTMLKKIPIPKRHQDTFGGYEYNFTGQRGVMLHTDRYQVRRQYEALKTLEGLNQRDRLLAEMAYLEDLRSIRRRREVVPHRVQLDLFLGGKKLEYEERFDIKREIQRLKAMAMPVRARDLFHGKGIHLPADHMSLLPRQPGPDDSDSDEEVRISAPASMQRATEHTFLDLQSPTFERRISLTLGDFHNRRDSVRSKRHQHLPNIGKSQTPRGTGRDDTSAPTSQPQTSRSAAWVQEQNQLLSQPSGKPTHDEKHHHKGRHSTQDAGRTVTREKRHSPEFPPLTSEQESRLGETPQTSGAAEGARAGVTLRSGSSQGRRVLITEDESQFKGEGRQASPPVSHTPNPLKAGLVLEVSEEQASSLRQTFQRLDTDMDGHLQYHQLKSQLPKEFSQQQEYFVKQVYEITRTSGAFFGVDEFLMMTQLTSRVASLTGQAQEAYGKIDFEELEGAIIKYVDLFQSADASQKGRISADMLKDLIGRSQNKPALAETSPVWNTILDHLSLDYASQVNRIEYLAHIPLFMELAPPALSVEGPASPTHSAQEEDNDQ